MNTLKKHTQTKARWQTQPTTFSQLVNGHGLCHQLKFLDGLLLIGLIGLVFLGRYFYPSWYNFWYSLCGISLVYVWVSWPRRYRLNATLFTNQAVSQLTLQTLLLLFSGLMLLFSLSVNFSQTGFNLAAVTNLTMILAPMAFLFFAKYLKVTYAKAVSHKLLRYYLYFATGYFWLNVPLILAQHATGTFMIRNFGSTNAFIADNFTGLMGMEATGILNVYWNSLLVVTLVYAISCQKRAHKIKWGIIASIEGALMVYFAIAVNENKAFLPTLAVVLTFLFIRYFLSKHSVLALLKWSIPLIIGGIISFLILMQLPFVAEVVQSLLQLASQFADGSFVDPSNERAYLLHQAYHHYNAHMFGLGFSKVTLATQTLHVHFGLSSLLVVLIFGGQYVTIALLFTYSLLAQWILPLQNVASYLLEGCATIVFFLVISIATQPFRDPYILFFIAVLYWAAAQLPRRGGVT